MGTVLFVRTVCADDEDMLNNISTGSFSPAGSTFCSLCPSSMIPNVRKDKCEYCPPGLGPQEETFLFPTFNMTIRKLAFDPLGANVSKLSNTQLRIEFPPAYHYGKQKCDLELLFKTDLQVGFIMTSTFDFVQSRYASRGLPQYFSMLSAPYESDSINAPLLYSFGGLLSSNFPPSKLGLMMPQG